jgi:hypothetical protein
MSVIDGWVTVFDLTSLHVDAIVRFQPPARVQALKAHGIAWVNRQHRRQIA